MIPAATAPPAMAPVCELLECVEEPGEELVPFELPVLPELDSSPGQLVSFAPAVVMRPVLVPHCPFASLTETVCYNEHARSSQLCAEIEI